MTIEFLPRDDTIEGIDPPSGLPPPISMRVSDDQSGNSGFYTTYTIQSWYEWRSGQFPAAVAASAGPQLLMQLHAPKEFHVIMWTCQRIGSKPKLPHWDISSFNPNEVCIRRRIFPASPEQGLDGTLVWKASGVYVYSLRAPIGSNGPFFTGATPDTTYSPDELMLGQELFDYTILRSSPIGVQEFVGPVNPP